MNWLRLEHKNISCEHGFTFYSRHSIVSWAENIRHLTLKNKNRGFPGGAVVENLPADAGDTGLSPGLGRSHMPWSN